jgi:hypothetical protein
MKSMSVLLDRALDPERRKACEENDRLLNVVPELCVIHEREENRLRETREAAAIAADLARNERKGERLAAVNDDAAFAVQQQWLDAMRRAGL